jgi:dCMP deaminase
MGEEHAPTKYLCAAGRKAIQWSCWLIPDLVILIDRTSCTGYDEEQTFSVPRRGGFMKSAISESTLSADHARPSWNDYFFEIAHAVSKRATCDRGKSGCVVVRDKRILVTGFVGSPSGFPHCDDVGHQIKRLIHENGRITEHCTRTIHAEQNAICQAAKQGISLDGATLYTRMTPCRTCAMLVINCGITRVFCERKYHAGHESEVMFQEAGIPLKYNYHELQQY